MMKVKEESEKVGLKLNIQKMKIMVSGQIDGETVEIVRLFSWAPKSLDGNCSHKVKRCLLLGRKAMTNLDNILENRNTLSTEV